MIVQYFPYYGGLGLPNPYLQSKYEYVKERLPQLKIDERYTAWSGFSVPYLAFRLTEENKTGYAICQTNAKQTAKKVIDIGGDLLLACVTAPDFDRNESTEGRYVTCGVEYTFLIDRNLRDIMMSRLRRDTSSWRKKYTSSKSNGLEEKGLSYCWINARIKTPDDRFNGKIIDDIVAGVYDDIDWYDYSLPEGKWKSEQLVYEMVQQLYPKSSVIYQYRPEFLHIGSRQLSYDVYICKQKIAIEYQGKQHYEPVEIFGGSDGFKKQRERDELKRFLSKKNGVKLVYINYWEDITQDLLREKIENDYDAMEDIREHLKKC